MNISFIEKIDPVNFAFIMATGVIAIAGNVTGWMLTSYLFLTMGAIAYSILVVVFSLRLILFPKLISQELWDVLALCKYLTFCAGSNSLSVSFSLSGYNQAGLILGIVGGFFTLILVFTIFFHLFFSARQSIQAISPYWLLMAIACNSTGIAITTLWDNGVLAHPFFLLISFGYWTFGILIYIIFMTLNIYRMFFLDFIGKDLYPAYWTCMGAAAIAVVDGNNLATISRMPEFLTFVTGFIHAIDLMFWCWGTMWIVILCLMESAKYAYFKVSYRYSASLWATIFPLAMYTVATCRLSEGIHLGMLQVMLPYCLWTAIGCWAFVGLSGIYRFGQWWRGNLEPLT